MRTVDLIRRELVRISVSQKRDSRESMKRQIEMEIEAEKIKRASWVAECLKEEAKEEEEETRNRFSMDSLFKGHELKGRDIMYYLDEQLEELAEYTATAYGLPSEDNLLDDKEGDRLMRENLKKLRERG
jgi:hypothetical protein